MAPWHGFGLVCGINSFNVPIREPSILLVASIIGCCWDDLEGGAAWGLVVMMKR